MPDGARPTLEALVADWLAGLRSPNTRSAYASDFRRFASWCSDRRVDPMRFDARDLARYRTSVERTGASSATTARRLSAIASFGTFAAGRGVVRGFADVRRPTVVGTRVVDSIDDVEADALLRAADRLTARAGVLVRLLMLDGLKVGEAAAADAAAVSGRPPTMVLRIADRAVELHPDTAAVLHSYLARRREGPLLLSEGRARRSDRLSRFGIDYLVKEIAAEAGLRGPVSGTMLRRRYVAAAYAGGEPLDEIRRHAGHADVRTTRRCLAPDSDREIRRG